MRELDARNVPLESGFDGEVGDVHKPPNENSTQFFGHFKTNTQSLGLIRLEFVLSKRVGVTIATLASAPKSARHYPKRPVM